MGGNGCGAGWSCVARGALAIALLTVAGCGGGGGSGSAGTGGGTLVTPTPTPVSGSARADAGADVAVTLPDSRVALAGAASGGTVQWSQVSGPATVAFQDTASAATAVAADREGIYTLRMAVRDGAGAVLASDDVQLTVRANPVQIGAGSTALDHLRAVPRPALRQGHTLLPLAISSCSVAPEIRLELTRHWGYGAQVSEGTNVATDPVVAEVKANPGRFPLVFSQASLTPVFRNFAGQNPALPRLPAETYLRDAAGEIILRGGQPTVSPIAPDAAMEVLGNYVGQAMRRLERETGQRFDFVANNGEYGLWLAAENEPAAVWGVDPRVVAAMQREGLDPANREHWFRFVSRNKARQERIVKETAYANLQLGRPRAYSWYQEAFGPERGRWAGWPWYMFLWEEFLDSARRPQVSDFSAPEFYFNFHNSGWAGVHPQTGIPWDALTTYLRNQGGIRALGQSLSYAWVSQGWDGGDSGGISDDDLYIGALKAMYTAGTIGAVAGYFTCTGAPFEAMRSNGVAGAAAPTQIRGMINLGKVHALFTFLEPFLRDGDLLTGDGTHPYTAFDSATPAMEFDVPGEIILTPDAGRPANWAIRKARVVARKMRGADRWLVTAWANNGDDRDIRVTIDPRLGQLTLRARRAGSVYIVTLQSGTPQVRLIDTDAMNPTRGLFPGQGAP